MDFELSEEQRLYQDSARKMVERKIRPELDSHDRDRPLPKEAMLRIFQVFDREGLTAPRLAVADGGSGMRMLDYGLVFEELPSMVGHALLSHEVSIARIRAGSPEEVWRRLLPDLIAGRKVCCTGSTEPDTGSDPRGGKTRMRFDGEDVVGDGRRMGLT